MDKIDEWVSPAGTAGVYAAPLAPILASSPPLLLDGRPVTALAPHPHEPEMVYLTTENPDVLRDLPEPVVWLA